MQCARNSFRKYLCRFYSSNSTYILEELKDRCLVRVSGEDASGLLQGLITNDMLQMTTGNACMYAMLLNNRGRILYDTIIIRPSLESVYYLDVDKQAAASVKKHLLTYRLRKQIDVSIDSSFKVWVYFDPNLLENSSPITETLPAKITNQPLNDAQEYHIFRDPRIAVLGRRIIAPNDADSALRKLYPGTNKLSLYKRFRFRLGVGEGIEELPPGNCFPMEANCDYLHGINFQKGCYIGQELTARTFHTGVIRKRLMPLLFDKRMLYKPAKNEPILSNENNNVGKLRGFETDSGIGLMRVQQALSAEKLFLNNNIPVETQRPNWWPEELPKEKIAVQK